MKPEIIELANKLNTANKAFGETITPNRPIGDMNLYHKSCKAFREFWDAVDKAGIDTKEAFKLVEIQN